MLSSKRAERLTANEVLRHPWICENGVAPDRALDPAVLSHLKQFSAMNNFKKMALKVIAESLSEEEIAGLREMFQAMDTDNSGAITFDEPKASLRKYGSTLKDTEIHDLMEAADVDNSGTIDYSEFIAATIHLNKLEREESLEFDFYRYNIPELAKKYKVYALDLLGFGWSDKALYDAMVWTDQVIDFMKEIVKEPAVVVGNSLGGFTALTVAVGLPEQVTRVVLLNSAGQFVAESIKREEVDESVITKL